MTFVRLIFHNVGVKRLRLALTSLAIAIGVVTVVSLGVVTASLETSALAIMQTGRADFTIAQKGVSDIINSNITEPTLNTIQGYPGVGRAIGVLLSTTKLNAANPLFIEIGIDPTDLGAFGVTIVQGTAFRADATDELMLGWRAAESLGLHVGDRLHIEGANFRVVGIYSTGQALGDAGVMYPLKHMQAMERQAGQLTLMFVQVKSGTNVAALRARIERDHPQLVTIRTTADFGRADRSLSLIKAANSGSRVLTIVIGAIVVMSAMTMSFVERMREFGVLAAVGWSRRRVATMILCEAMVIGLLGAAVGTAFSYVAVRVVQQLPGLTGVLDPQFTSDIFGRALFTAAAMSLLGGLYPALRAAFTSPLAALRHE